MEAVGKERIHFCNVNATVCGHAFNTVVEGTGRMVQLSMYGTWTRQGKEVKIMRRRKMMKNAMGNGEWEG